MLQRFEKLKSLPIAINPAPNKAPTRLWVVDMGIPIFVAMNTVIAAPKAIEIAKIGDWIISLGTNHFPEKFFTNSSAKKIAATDPEKVVIVAHRIALL